jgi:hypothetical protein
MGYDVLFDNFGSNAKPPQLQTTVDVDVLKHSDFLKNGGILVTSRPDQLSQADARAHRGFHSRSNAPYPSNGTWACSTCSTTITAWKYAMWGRAVCTYISRTG